MSGPVLYLNPVQLRRDLDIRDLSDPAEGAHAIQILIDLAVAELSRAWGAEVRWCRGPRIVPVAEFPAAYRSLRPVQSRSMAASGQRIIIGPAVRNLASLVFVNYLLARRFPSFPALGGPWGGVAAR